MEATFAYHTVVHSHSYLSADCTAKLSKYSFNDSRIAIDFTCGRTKSTKICNNVLSKFATNMLINDLQNDRPFSIATDAFKAILRPFLY